ncbi:hypothetical protein EsH8_VII_000678 [Colletotrichum jinshuiense]
MESPFFDGRGPRPESQPRVASFQGRLQLQEYMFKPASTQPGQALPTTTTAAAPLQSPSPAPLRRSPRKATPLGPVPSSDRVAKRRGGSGGNPARPSASSSAPKSGSPSVSPKLESPEPAGAAPRREQKPKRKRKAAGYAPPATYAHLDPLVDILAPNLLILFVGLNPGLQTAREGHIYAHPSNLFWKLLHSSGITPRLCAPAEDRELPRLYSLGSTNIVSRPSRNGSELSKAEMDDGVGVLEDKVRGCRPETVCIVGKSIWESIWRVRHGKGIKKGEFRYGWQDEGENMGVVGGKASGGSEAWAGARVFVASSTSGLAATLLPAEKERIWRELGAWCERRRAERVLEA